jgi:two-component system cell cycle sensor histidine kinase/response regulator CckA
MGEPGQATGSTRCGASERTRVRPAVLDYLLDALDEGLVVVDAAGELILSNAAARRMLALTETAPPLQEWPRSFGLCLPDASLPWPPEQFPLIRALGGEAVRGVEMLVRPAGAREDLWVSATALPLGSPGDPPQGALMLLRDISETRRVREALNRERDWASTIVDTVGSLVVVLDREGRIISFNRACERTTGYSFEEVLGRPIWDLLLVAEEAPEVRRVFQRLCAGDFPNQHENHWVTRSGERRLIVWSNTVLLDQAGRVEYVIGTGIDVTERRQAERRLRRLDETLRALLEASPLAIWAVDPEGKVEFWNPAAERMFGWSEQEILHRPLPLGVEDQPEALAELLELSRRGETLRGLERRQRRRDGSPIELSLWTAPLREESGRLTAVLGVAADVTQTKQLEEQFRQAQKMEAVGRLAGGVAHDFNNLLTIITGYGQMLSESLPLGDPLLEPVGEILKAAGSAARLAGQLLMFSRKQRSQRSLVDLNDIVAGMDRMLRRVLGEDIELVTHLGAGPAPVRADPVHLEQVIMNLVVNAREAMPEGGRITLETAPVILDEEYARNHLGVRPGPHVMLAVSDTGKGMDADTLRQAFEPFFTTKQKGTGLGLSTVYGIVQQHGGRIWAYSEPGLGTTFKIYLPLAEGALESAPPAGPPHWALGGGETILVAEDDPELRKLIAEVLRREGYNVLPAAHAQEALQICQQYPGRIDLLLTDVVMPALGGRELAERALGCRPSLKVLYMSGYADRAVVENGILPQEEVFLEKPFTKETLLRKLRQALETA